MVAQTKDVQIILVIIGKTNTQKKEQGYNLMTLANDRRLYTIKPGTQAKKNKPKHKTNIKNFNNINKLKEYKGFELWF